MRAGGVWGKLGRLGFNFATAVFEANRIDPLLILIGLKQSEPDPEQYSQHHQKNHRLPPSPKSAPLIGQSKDFAPTIHLGISAKAAFSPCSLRRSPAIALIISLGSHPASHISGISHSPAEVTRWWRFDHAAGKSASFLFVDHPSLDRFAVETPVGAYPECGQLVLP